MRTSVIHLMCNSSFKKKSHSIFFEQVAAILLLACAVSGQWNAQPSQNDVARQFHSQDGYGQANFGYSHPGQSAVTQRDAQGHQRGSYAYINPEGREIRVNFIADENGYRVDNNYVEETNEVAAARAAHMAAHAAALTAAREASPSQQSWDQPKKTAPAPQPTWTAPVQPQQVYSAPVVQQTWSAPDTRNWVQPHPTFGYVPQSVQETPEVLAARAEFYRAYNEAAARAPSTSEVVPQKQTWSAPVQQTPVQQTWSAPVQQTWSAPSQQNYSPVQVDQYGLPVQVQDTPDVQAAKAEFYRAFNAAARAAQKP